MPSTRNALTWRDLFTWSCVCAVALASGAAASGAVAAEPAAPPVHIEPDIVYASPGGEQLLLDLYLPTGSGPFPCVLVVHGGAWRIGGKLQLSHYARGLAERGFVAAAISYRLAPRHRFPAQLDDCRCALTWIGANAERYSIDVDRLGAIGYSAGGHLVELLAVESQKTSAAGDKEKSSGSGGLPRLKAVAAGGAPCDFRSMPADSRVLAYWLGGSRSQLPDVYKAASPAAFVQAGDPPMFLFHGKDDILVPVAESRRMAGLLHDAGVECESYEVEGAGHIATMFQPEALRRAIDFLQQHL